MNIVLISCVSKKRNCKSKARDLYQSPLFKKEYEFAKARRPDKIYILSAKYGIISEDEEIEPYDITLNEMKKNEISTWADMVVSKLQTLANLNEDEFTILAGEKYREFIIPHLKKYNIPMRGMKIGQQLQFLTRHT